MIYIMFIYGLLHFHSKQRLHQRRIADLVICDSNKQTSQEKMTVKFESIQGSNPGIITVNFQKPMWRRGSARGS